MYSHHEQWKPIGLFMLYIYLVLFTQIILESLPVSSSGHVALVTILFQKYAQLPEIPSNIFDAWFDSLHAITALIIALFFFAQWSFLLFNLKRTWRIVFKLSILILLTDLITCGWYVLLHYYPISLPLFFGFCITALILLSLKCISAHSQKRSLNLRDALILGSVQGFALLPGISRFATTFATARFLGFTNERAFQLTWMIQWPLIAAASLLGFYKLQSADALAQFYSGWLVGAYALAGVGGYVALSWAHQLAITNRLWRCAYYMIVPLVIAILI